MQIQTIPKQISVIFFYDYVHIHCVVNLMKHIRTNYECKQIQNKNITRCQFIIKIYFLNIYIYKYKSPCSNIHNK